MKTLIALFLLAAALGSAAVNQTTLQTGISATATTITLANSTGVNSTGVSEIRTGLYMDREYMEVQAGAGANSWKVRREAGGTRSAHAAGAVVYVARPTDFSFSPLNPAGNCAPGAQALPLVVIWTGDVFDCPSTGPGWTLITTTNTPLLYLPPMSLTAAQIHAAINGSPITIAAAPGAGKFYGRLFFAAEVTSGTTTVQDYTDGDTGISMCFGNAWNGVCDTQDALGTLLGQGDIATQGPVAYANYAANATGGAPSPSAVDQPLQIGSFYLGQHSGRITAATIGSSGGSGYAMNDAGTITNNDPNSGTPTLATYQVTSVDGGGAVTGLTVTLGGTQYYAETDGAVATTATSGAGSGLTLDITAIESYGLSDQNITIYPSYAVCDVAIGCPR